MFCYSFHVSMPDVVLLMRYDGSLCANIIIDHLLGQGCQK